MKFLYLVPVLVVSAALGASNASPGREQTPPARSSGAPATPPWLQELSEEEADEAGTESDPHAGLHATPPDTASGACTYDPNAAAGCESCEEEGGPHAGVYAEDPHAGVYPSDDPHAGMYAADDPHAGIYPGEAAYVDEAADEPPPHAFREPVNAAPVERSRAANGKTVAEVFSARSALAQTRITVRGTVVKLTEGVLGKNYLHLRDGTGTARDADDDLTVTTTEAFSLGETVEVEGQLAIDQDVGVGYSYPALLADASRVQR